MHQECRNFASLWALDEAKKNVEQHFAVVGIYERLEESVSVLEEKLPEVFKGVKTISFDNIGKFNVV